MSEEARQASNAQSRFWLCVFLVISIIVTALGVMLAKSAEAGAFLDLIGKMVAFFGVLAIFLLMLVISFSFD